jgi:hypothetical protein
MNGNTGYRSGLPTTVMGIIVLAVVHLSPVCAGGPIYDEGLAAYASGDIATAFQLWRPLAEHGDADAQFALASLYYDGIGVPADHMESSYWFLLAAKQGHAGAQYNIGNAYKRGEGVHQSDAMAVHWWEKAAGQGLAEAQFNLALAYQEGAGVAKDKQMAARYYRQAAENGHPDASSMTADPDRPAQSPDATDCESWLASQSPNAYTLQLMSTTHPEDIQALAREHDLSGYIVCRYTHEGSSRHALLIGAYPDINTASAAAAHLPPGLKTGKPWVRRIKDLMRIAVGHAP